MSLLAYDPARLRGLEQSLRRAIDELWSVRCDDPSGADAIRTVRTVAGALSDTWVPVVRDVLASHAMLADDAGWRLLDDPLPATAPSPGDVETLAAHLEHVDLAALAGDPAALQWVTTQLDRIATDPSLSTLFCRRFSGWEALSAQLGDRRARFATGVEPDADTHMVALDGCLAALGRVLHASANGDAYLARMTPYSAALALAGMGLTGDELGLTAVRLLDRWLDDDTIQADDHYFDDTPNTADLLFTMMLHDHEATVAFLRLAAYRPDLLLRTAHDPKLAYAVALEATDPAGIAIADAQQLVVPLIRWFQQGNIVGPDPAASGEAGWRMFLVDLVAPWTMQMSPLCNDWSLTAQDQSALMTFVMSYPAATDHFVADRDAVLNGLLHSLETDRHRPVEEVAAYLGMLGQLVVNARMNDAAQRAAAWRLMASALTIAIGALPLGAGASVAVSSLSGFGAEAIIEQFAPDPDQVSQNELYGKDLALAIYGSAIVNELFNEWRAAELLPDWFPPPPVPDPSEAIPSAEWLFNLGFWRDGLPGNRGGPLGSELIIRLFPVVNPYVIGEHVGQWAAHIDPLTPLSGKKRHRATMGQ